MPDQVNLFISYSHDDENSLAKLKKFLTPMNCPAINVWDDRRIPPGDEWDEVIKNQLENSQIILLLISQDFLNSKYINNLELKRAMERHEEKKSVVIPIFLRNCIFQNHKHILKLQGYPHNKQFLNELGENADREYVLIVEKINEAANDLLTDRNIQKSLDTEGLKSDEARLIDSLSSNKKIFLSIPDSVSGQTKRKEFLYSAMGREQYEGWPFEIVPTINDIRKLDALDEEGKTEYITSLIKDSLFAIHILMTSDELDEGFDKLQYDIAKQHEKESEFFSNILWLPDPELSERLDDELLMNPTIVGNNYEPIFALIDSKNKEKEAKIAILRNGFSPNKMIYMFYDFHKDHDNELRIKLKTELEKKRDIVVKFSLPGEPLESDRKELLKSEGCCIFYGKSNPEWFVIRQALLYDTSSSYKKALCVADPDIKLKMDRDVSVGSYDYIIQGVNDFSNKLPFFIEGISKYRNGN